MITATAQHTRLDPIDILSERIPFKSRYLWHMQLRRFMTQYSAGATTAFYFHGDFFVPCHVTNGSIRALGESKLPALYPNSLSIEQPHHDAGGIAWVLRYSHEWATNEAFHPKDRPIPLSIREPAIIVQLSGKDLYDVKGVLHYD